MVGNKSTMEQIHEYEKLVFDILNKGMKMCEILQANVLLEKFLLSWSDYRNYLKHKKRSFSSRTYRSHANRRSKSLKDKFSTMTIDSNKANLVETGNQLNVEKIKNKGKKPQIFSNLKNQNLVNKNYKIQ